MNTVDGGQDGPLDAEAVRLAEVYRQADAIRKEVDANPRSWWWRLKFWFSQTKPGLRLTMWQLRRHQDSEHMAAELARVLSTGEGQAAWAADMANATEIPDGRLPVTPS